MSHLSLNCFLSGFRVSALSLAAVLLLTGGGFTDVYAQDAEAEPLLEKLGLEEAPAEPEPVPDTPELEFLNKVEVEEEPEPEPLPEGVSDVLQKIGEAADEINQKAEEAEQAAPAEDLVVPPVVIDEKDVPQPAAKELASPVATDPVMPDIPSIDPEEDPDENLFFDAESLVPQGEMGTKGGPRKVNPRLQPGSKLIVVKKNYSSGSRQAMLVSAQRAMKLGRYDAALEMYETLYQKNKRDPNILIGRAEALQRTGRTDEAIQAYEALLDLRPNNVEAKVNMFGLMGQRYPAVALRRLMELRNDNPDHVGIVAQIAVVQSQLGRYDEAVRYLGVAASMEPQNASHIFNLAVTADRAGHKKEAISYYEQALEVDTIYGGGRSIPRESVYERLAQLR